MITNNMKAILFTVGGCPYSAQCADRIDLYELEDEIKVVDNDTTNPEELALISKHAVVLFPTIVALDTDERLQGRDECLDYIKQLNKNKKK